MSGLGFYCDRWEICATIGLGKDGDHHQNYIGTHYFWQNSSPTVSFLRTLLLFVLRTLIHPWCILGLKGRYFHKVPSSLQFLLSSFYPRPKMHFSCRFMMALFQKDDILVLDSDLHKNEKKVQCKTEMRVNLLFFFFLSSVSLRRKQWHWLMQYCEHSAKLFFYSFYFKKWKKHFRISNICMVKKYTDELGLLIKKK